MIRLLIAGVVAIGMAGLGQAAIIARGTVIQDYWPDWYPWPNWDFVDVGDPMTLTVLSHDTVSQLVALDPLAPGTVTARLQIGDVDFISAWWEGGMSDSIFNRATKTSANMHVGGLSDFNVDIGMVISRFYEVTENVSDPFAAVGGEHPEPASFIMWAGLLGICMLNRRCGR